MCQALEAGPLMKVSLLSLPLTQLELGSGKEEFSTASLHFGQQLHIFHGFRRDSFLMVLFTGVYSVLASSM